VDLSGFWMPVDAVKHLLNLAADLPPGSVPLQPWADALYKERIDNNGKDHPGARCWPSGIPEKNNIPDGMKIVQTPDLMLFLYESRTIYRQIFTDGRSHPKNDPQPTWQGYSIGKWEGDTFVVVTIDDPKAYTRPWDVKLAWRLIPDTDLIESICEENNRDLPHMVGK
jgi:hypothetical protein